ncbi:MAG: DUF1810 domain-containing protein [Piscinibacter sp.]|nr:DUF1810 domain-containing protein [Piscinibacter sp.]
MDDDSFDLQRFVDAQSPVYAQALAELHAGSKSSHWMWFVFPQLRGLGHSPMAQRYGLADAAEALAYRSHATLGPRLAECTAAMLSVEGRSARQILGTPDDLKFRSCMTLFAQVAPGDPLFRRALERYFDGLPDARTLELLQ